MGEERRKETERKMRREAEGGGLKVGAQLRQFSNLTRSCFKIKNVNELKRVLRVKAVGSIPSAWVPGRQKQSEGGREEEGGEGEGGKTRRKRS